MGRTLWLYHSSVVATVGMDCQQVNTSMLLVYLEPLALTQIQLLNTWSEYVRYWPRSRVNTHVYSAAIPTDYWLLFNQQLLATQWLLQYPDHTRVVRTLFD
jgi:hypothetical protein